MASHCTTRNSALFPHFISVAADRSSDLWGLMADVSPKFVMARPAGYVPITPPSLAATARYQHSPLSAYFHSPTHHHYPNQRHHSEEPYAHSGNDQQPLDSPYAYHHIQPSHNIQSHQQTSDAPYAQTHTNQLLLGSPLYADPGYRSANQGPPLANSIHKAALRNAYMEALALSPLTAGLGLSGNADFVSPRCSSSATHSTPGASESFSTCGGGSCSSDSGGGSRGGGRARRSRSGHLQQIKPPISVLTSRGSSQRDSPSPSRAFTSSSSQRSHSSSRNGRNGSRLYALPPSPAPEPYPPCPGAAAAAAVTLALSGLNRTLTPSPSPRARSSSVQSQGSVTQPSRARSNSYHTPASYSPQVSRFHPAYHSPASRQPSQQPHVTPYTHTPLGPPSDFTTPYSSRAEDAGSQSFAALHSHTPLRQPADNSTPCSGKLGGVQPDYNTPDSVEVEEAGSDLRTLHSRGCQAAEPSPDTPSHCASLSIQHSYEECDLGEAMAWASLTHTASIDAPACTAAQASAAVGAVSDGPPTGPAAATRFLNLPQLAAAALPFDGVTAGERRVLQTGATTGLTLAWEPPSLHQLLHHPDTSRSALRSSSRRAPAGPYVRRPRSPPWAPSSHHHSPSERIGWSSGAWPIPEAVGGHGSDPGCSTPPPCAAFHTVAESSGDDLILEPVLRTSSMPSAQTLSQFLAAVSAAVQPPTDPPAPHTSIVLTHEQHITRLGTASGSSLQQASDTLHCSQSTTCGDFLSQLTRTSTPPSMSLLQQLCSLSSPPSSDPRSVSAFPPSSCERSGHISSPTGLADHAERDHTSPTRFSPFSARPEGSFVRCLSLQAVFAQTIPLAGPSGRLPPSQSSLSSGSLAGASGRTSSRGSHHPSLLPSAPKSRRSSNVAAADKSTGFTASPSSWLICASPGPSTTHLGKPGAHLGGVPRIVAHPPSFDNARRRPPPSVHSSQTAAAVQLYGRPTNLAQQQQKQQQLRPRLPSLPRHPCRFTNRDGSAASPLKYGRVPRPQPPDRQSSAALRQPRLAPQAPGIPAVIQSSGACAFGELPVSKRDISGVAAMELCCQLVHPDQETSAEALPVNQLGGTGPCSRVPQSEVEVETPSAHTLLGREHELITGDSGRAASGASSLHHSVHVGSCAGSSRSRSSRQPSPKLSDQAPAAGLSLPHPPLSPSLSAGQPSESQQLQLPSSASPKALLSAPPVPTAPLAAHPFSITSPPPQVRSARSSSSPLPALSVDPPVSGKPRCSLVSTTATVAGATANNETSAAADMAGATAYAAAAAERNAPVSQAAAAAVAVGAEQRQHTCRNLHSSFTLSGARGCMTGRPMCVEESTHNENTPMHPLDTRSNHGGRGRSNSIPLGCSTLPLAYSVPQIGAAFFSSDLGKAATGHQEAIEAAAITDAAAAAVGPGLSQEMNER